MPETIKSEINGRPIVTKSSLVQLWQRLGIQTGDTVIVHSSLKSLGFVIGGPEAVIQSLMETVDSTGTIILPTQSVELSDPATWEYPPANPADWQFIRDNQIPYDPLTTPVSKGLGIIPETFRKYPGVVRTSHPLYSFAIYGARQAELSHHGFDYGLGPDSPLGTLFSNQVPAKILMIGTDFETNTSIHLAEYWLHRPTVTQLVNVLEDGHKVTKQYKDIDMDLYDDFLEIQTEYQAQFPYQSEPIYQRNAAVYDFRNVVETAYQHFQTKEPKKSRRN
ncbi:AAC(3) family N-acetyltransferase [Fructilactobacillus cliffordii]|uniref:aminoglycoside N(3)-acetyltransferase n=1 Tax=Fructilactobacillus cliffordii TaxID=2940299 RepID=UPI002093BD50|nr:AAC(3) family N-acetyltransferase [Fructilactobacillus cliffordii]USS86358.1 AAC(3) family N-acetyltransferase [Fructilactobacillus cliffordii]